MVGSLSLSILFLSIDYSDFSQTDQPLTNNPAWSLDDVFELFSAGEAGRLFLQYVAENPVTLVSFAGATDTYTNPDGSQEVVDLSDGLLGNFDRRRNIIRVNANLGTLDAAMTIFHEYMHQAKMGEVEARIRTEQFAISMGWPETFPGYRNPDGTVNTEIIKGRIRRSSHYNPTRPRVRRYSGEVVLRLAGQE